MACTTDPPRWERRGLTMAPLSEGDLCRRHESTRDKRLGHRRGHAKRSMMDVPQSRHFCQHHSGSRTERCSPHSERLRQRSSGGAAHSRLADPENNQFAFQPEPAASTIANNACPGSRSPAPRIHSHDRNICRWVFAGGNVTSTGCSCCRLRVESANDRALTHRGTSAVAGPGGTHDVRCPHIEPATACTTSSGMD